ncbi:MAG: flagellar basal body-associated FliL family protein [bacterium]
MAGEKPNGNKEMSEGDSELSSVEGLDSKKIKNKSGLKKIIFIVVPLLILLGGGFAVYRFILSKPAGKIPPGAINVRKNITPGNMIELKPFLTNLANKNSSSYVKASITVELKPGGNAALLKQLTPQIRNSIIMILSSKTSHEINTPAGITALRHQIARSLNRILGRGQVVSVYFNNYLVQ